MIDPDHQQAWADAQRLRDKACREQTQGKHSFAEGSCRHCGATDPNPRVTLTTSEYRAVYMPKTGDVRIEKRSTDSLGADRWDVIDTLTNTQSRSEKSHAHIIALLTRGVKP
jgi:hypothetical protein